jgi:hypothetical protein
MERSQSASSDQKEKVGTKSKSFHFSPLLEAVLELRKFEQTQNQTTSERNQNSSEESST